MIGCGGWGAEVEDAEVRVGGDRGEDGGRVWREGDGVGTGVGGDCEERVGAGGRPLFFWVVSELLEVEDEW